MIGKFCTCSIGTSSLTVHNDCPVRLSFCVGFHTSISTVFSSTSPLPWCHCMPSHTPLQLHLSVFSLLPSSSRSYCLTVQCLLFLPALSSTVLFFSYQFGWSEMFVVECRVFSLTLSLSLNLYLTHPTYPSCSSWSICLCVLPLIPPTHRHPSR